LNRRVCLTVLLSVFLAPCTAVPTEQPQDQAKAAPAIVAFFSPTPVTEESIRDETIRRIDKPAQTLGIAIYAFTEPKFTEAWIRAKARGVSVRIIMDNLQAGGSTSQADELRAAGIPVKLMRGIKGNGIMHHKVAIYDGRTVQTGSFNLTDNASCCSWENALFIGTADVVKRYQQMFELM
jgi:phosphatidylserine/phosphatidylglycerophosphate/cardiolipin synthase-like enzyme